MDKPLVRITWLDASDSDDVGPWFSDEDMEKFEARSTEVVSVGWLKSETKQYITLAADWYENLDGTHTWGRPTKIPSGMVQKKEVLTVNQNG